MSSETSNVVIPAASPGGAETVAQTQTQTQTQEVPATTAAGDSMEGIETGDAPASTENTSGGNTQQAGETERYRWPTLEMELEEKRLTYIDYLKSPIITILVGSGESQTSLSAHLALLQSSPWFTDACASYTAATPPNERIVELIDDDIEAVGAFLEYLYTREYAPRLVPGSSGRAEEMVLEETADNDVDEGGEHLLKHAKVYTLAGKLRLPELKSLAHSKIHRINSTAKGELRYAKFVYENTTPDDKTIRQPIASFWAHRSHVLRHEAEDEFRGMVLAFPQFAYDILSIVLDQKEKGKDKDREHRGKGPTAGGPADDSSAISAAKTPRTGRKRPRTGL